MKIFGWYFCPLYISIKGGLLVLLCVFNKCPYDEDREFMRIEFRKKYYHVRRTSLSILGITLLEEEFKLKGRK